MSARAEGVRERRKRARRGAIIDAAQRLVGEFGYDGVTTGRIAAEAGVSPRTFFNYFESKEQAVIGIPPDAALDRDVAERFAAGGPTGHLLEDLRDLLDGMLRHLGDEPTRVRAAVELIRREPRLLAHHADAVERHRTELLDLFESRYQAIPGTPDPETLLVAAGALAQATALAWVRSGGTRPVGDHIEPAAAALGDIFTRDGTSAERG